MTQMQAFWTSLVKPTEWIDYIPLNFKGQSGISVDIGCGSRPRNPTRARELVGVDVVHPQDFPSEAKFFLTKPGMLLPMRDQSIDIVTAFDFLEHLPRAVLTSEGELRNLFIEGMNEISRVLKSGGLLIAVTPAFPSEASFADPTHVNYVSMETIDYFAGPTHARTLGYGFTGDFEIVKCCWLPWSSPLYSRDEHGEPVNSLDWVGRRPKPWRHAAKLFLHRVGFRKPIAPVHLLWVLKRL